MRNGDNAGGRNQAEGGLDPDHTVGGCRAHDGAIGFRADGPARTGWRKAPRQPDRDASVDTIRIAAGDSWVVVCASDRPVGLELRISRYDNEGNFNNDEQNRNIESRRHHVRSARPHRL